MTLKNIFNHFYDDVRTKSCAINFADTFNSVVGNEFEKNEISSTKMRRWISYYKCF